MGTIVEAVVTAATAAVMLMAAVDAAAQQPVQQRTQERAGWREIIPGSENNHRPGVVTRAVARNEQKIRFAMTLSNRPRSA